MILEAMKQIRALQRRVDELERKFAEIEQGQLTDETRALIAQIARDAVAASTGNSVDASKRRSTRRRKSG